ncbi:MAG: 5-oxoprolinase subunit PxpA [Vicinamibacterales bacterium]|nr:5-oxoprolinase subunit PxpA [Vicinamibacterales bacterium]
MEAQRHDRRHPRARVEAGPRIPRRRRHLVSGHCITIDLNADVGEAVGSAGRALDRRLLAFLSSANIACGGHAGDDVTMRDTVEAALAHGVAVGAHPGYPDREGFGRRETGAAPAAVAALVREQTEALLRVVTSSGGTLRHLKLHGALYHRAHHDRAVADAVAGVVTAIDPALIVVGMDGSALMQACGDLGLLFAREAFADRAYASDGQLVPREQPDSVLTAEVAARRVVRMVRDGVVGSIDGVITPLRFDTLCAHSDTPDAVELARSIRLALVEAGVMVAPMKGARPT